MSSYQYMYMYRISLFLSLHLDLDLVEIYRKSSPSYVKSYIYIYVRFVASFPVRSL